MGEGDRKALTEDIMMCKVMHSSATRTYLEKMHSNSRLGA